MSEPTQRNARGPEARRTDYERMAARYDRGRALSLERIGAWRDALHPYLAEAGGRVLDVGSGTGLWSGILANWFNVDVVGVEPSEAMRRQAAAKHSGYGVWFVGGRAEGIPVRTEACDHAWLSTVLHHIEDLQACARELRRVLRGPGTVLIRSSFGDRIEGIHWLEFFPAAAELARRRWPRVETTTSTFRDAGFEPVTLLSVDEVIADGWPAYRNRIAVRANSTLELIDDEDFAEGLARLDDLARGSSSEKVVDRRDLLVLRRSGAGP
jgi:SAM-dependent methyltransferase